jgi:hypothetical protein
MGSDTIIGTPSPPATACDLLLAAGDGLRPGGRNHAKSPSSSANVPASASPDSLGIYLTHAPPASAAAMPNATASHRSTGKPCLTPINPPPAKAYIGKQSPSARETLRSHS